MATAPEVHSTFSVTSGGLCFGGLHNIWHGASVPIQGFPDARPHVSGTVFVHKLEFNVPALNGTWSAFSLVGVGGEHVCGWFICHRDIDARQEIDKILRVSGSPYEEDGGHTMNDSETNMQGVLVINRYDWGYYDNRYKEKIGDFVEQDEDGISPYSYLGIEAAGLVDYAQAKNQVQEWQAQHPSERSSSKAGVWMNIPQSEYMFGRFGFDDAHTAARSFLFFSGYIAFDHETFLGLQQTLRKYETHEERFERRLRDGYDFSGLVLLHKFSSPPANDPRYGPPILPPPPESERLGPYDKDEHILRAQDLDSLRLFTRPPQGVIAVGAFMDRKIAGFVDVEPWKGRVYDLLNELALSYLEHFVLPHISHATPATAADALFPNHGDSTSEESLDPRLYHYFTHPQAEPVANFDADFVGARIKNFLASRARDRPMAFDDCIAGICRVVAYLMSELLEFSSNAALDNHHGGIVPADIRISVYNDRGLGSMLKYSTVYWKGRE